MRARYILGRRAPREDRESDPKDERQEKLLERGFRLQTVGYIYVCMYVCVCVCLCSGHVMNVFMYLMFALVIFFFS
jgi:Flp pilus assembly protein TadB